MAKDEDYTKEVIKQRLQLEAKRDIRKGTCLKNGPG
jgi:hypothetical protein